MIFWRMGRLEDPSIENLTREERVGGGLAETPPPGRRCMPLWKRSRKRRGGVWQGGSQGRWWTSRAQGGSGTRGGSATQTETTTHIHLKNWARINLKKKMIIKKSNSFQKKVLRIRNENKTSRSTVRKPQVNANNHTNYLHDVCLLGLLSHLCVPHRAFPRKPSCPQHLLPFRKRLPSSPQLSTSTAIQTMWTRGIGWRSGAGAGGNRCEPDFGCIPPPPTGALGLRGSPGSENGRDAPTIDWLNEDQCHMGTEKSSTGSGRRARRLP